VKSWSWSAPPIAAGGAPPAAYEAIAAPNATPNAK
jgi:hypothetical protein